jgi:hypothetical protein
VSSGAGTTIVYDEETVILTCDTILSIHLADGVRLRLIPGGAGFLTSEIADEIRAAAAAQPKINFEVQH